MDLTGVKVVIVATQLLCAPAADVLSYAEGEHMSVRFIGMHAVGNFESTHLWMNEETSKWILLIPHERDDEGNLESYCLVQHGGPGALLNFPLWANPDAEPGS